MRFEKQVIIILTIHGDSKSPDSLLHHFVKFIKNATELFMENFSSEKVRIEIKERKMPS